MSETVDAEVVEVGAEIVPVGAPPPALFKTDDPVEVIEKATAVADALKGVLQRQGLTSTISGRTFVKVEGWTTLAAMLGVNAVCTGTEELPDGFRASVEARMPDGRVVGSADAMCTRKEKSWKARDDYALLSMAQTRATSKALRVPLGFVVTLAGYEATPSDEIPEAEQAPAVSNGRPPVLLSDDGRTKVLQAIADAGQPLALVLAAVGAEKSDDLTTADAYQIRELLDKAAS